MTPAAFLQAFAQAVANDGGLVLLFVVIFITGVRKVWVFGHALADLRGQLTDERIDFMRQLNAMREERDSWRQMSLYLQAQRGPTPPGPIEGD